MRLLVGAVLVLLSACGEDEERLIVEPADSPTEHSVTPTAPTPMETPSATPLITATVTSSATATAGTPTVTSTPTPTSTATPVDVATFVGIYDVSVRTVPSFGDSIAEVSIDDDGTVDIGIWFDGHSSVGLHGRPGNDGTIALEGQGVLEDDEIFLPQGHATFTQSGSTQRVSGAFDLDADASFGVAGTFELERPVRRPRSPHDGTYRVTLDPSPSGCECATTMTFTLGTDEQGVGTTLVGGDEVDADDVKLGTFDPFYCLVTPTGRLRCVFGYATTFLPPPGHLPSGPRFPVTLTGQLTGDGGQGVTDGPIFPEAFFLGGDWTATRVGP